MSINSLIKLNKSSLKHTKGFLLTPKNAWLMWWCQLLNLSILVTELSTWMVTVILLCLSAQATFLRKKFHKNTNYIKSHSFKKYKRLSPLILMIIAISGCVAIAISARSLGVLLSMLHLLTFAYTLKAFEIKQRKDFYQLLLLGLFLLASALIFKQTLAFSFLIICILVVNLTVLHLVFSPSKTILLASKTVIILLLQSTLLAVTLFIVFPRLSPFWQVPNASSAKTGLSDEVSPGDIASLALSSDLAFRVDFKGKQIPAYSSLYWRAMTLENFDGRKWTRKTNTTYKSSPNNSLAQTGFKPVISGESISYDITVEPNYQSWLFGLAVATSDNSQILSIPDYTLLSRNVLSQTSFYQVTSYLHSTLDLNINNDVKLRNLAIIKGSNPRLEKLANQLKQQYSEPLDRAKAVLKTFREKNYFYTLQAPTLIRNSLDQFYFDTKAGFCEHYASSFTYLMRASGIPARVVTGYLGGEYNNVNESEQQNGQYGGHLSVYQYDAHAWSEIWLSGIGWQRVDPTAAVDPQRVENGWSNALLTQQSSINNNLIGLYQFKNIAWLNSLRLQLDSLDYQWTRWVIGYSNERQYNLLKEWFGKHLPWKTAAIIAVAFIIAMVFITLFYRFDITRFKKKIEPEVLLYQKVLKVISIKGLVKPNNMTVLCFSTQVASHLPQISQEFHCFSKTFERLVYSNLTVAERSYLLCQLKEQYKKIMINLS